MGAISEGSIDPRTGRTRELLIGSAIRLIGTRGFDQTTVRQIADDAGVNIAAINYHFGGKDGLREAAVDAVADRMRAHGPPGFLEKMSEQTIVQMAPAEARAVLRQVMASALHADTVEKQLGDAHAFVQRELFQPGPSVKRFYETVFATQLGVLCLLVSRVTGEDPKDKQVRMRALTLLGQSVFLRMARPLVLEAMDWDDYGDAELDMIRSAFWLRSEPAD